MTSLLINGVLQSNFILSTPYKDTLDEELDQFNFQVKSTTRQTFKKNDKVVYLVKQGVYTLLQKVLCLFSCVESWEGGYWLYQLTCISPTKLLENIIINGMAETYPCADLQEQMDRVRLKINVQQDLEYTYISRIAILFDSSITGNDSITKGVAISDFLWDGQVNAREIFNDMLDKVDALIVATDYSVNANDTDMIYNITLGCVKRNPFDLSKRILFTDKIIENGGLEDVSEVVKGITFTRNSEFACGNIISLTKNAIAKDNVKQAYLPPRNSDLTIDEANKWHIITQEPIYTLNNVIAMMPTTNIDVYYWNYNSSTQQWETIHYHDSYNNPTMQLFIPIDITNYVVEKSVFDAMPISEQKNHLYFKRGEKGIYGLYDRYKSGLTGLFSNTALKNIMNDIGDNIPALTMQNSDGVIDWSSFDTNLLYGRSWNGSSDWTDVHKITDLKINTQKENTAIRQLVIHTGAHAFVSEENAYKECFFSVNYQPYCDSVVKIEKPNLEEARSKNLSVLKNQSDRTIDATKYYDSQEALIRRMGNKEMVIDAIVDLNETYDYKTTLWDLGAFMKIQNVEWKITQREFENYGSDKLKVKYTFSKEYNASNVDIQINRDKRLYGIPLSQYVDRYIIIKTGNAPYIDKLAVRCWDDFTGSTTTAGFDIMEMIKIGNANITDRVARCLDNYAVDIERTKYNSTIVNVYLRYCDTNGYIENIQLYGMTNDKYNSMTCSDYSRLPFKPELDFSSVGAGIYNLLLSGIKKDKMERLIFIIKS